jgi:hypothetical protein
MPQLVTNEGTVGSLLYPVVNLSQLRSLFKTSKFQDAGTAISADDHLGQDVGWMAPEAHQSLIKDWIQVKELGIAFPQVDTELEVMDVRSKRVLGLKSYLDMCISRLCIAPSVGRLAWKMWYKIDAESGGQLKIPNASPGPNGNILLTWDNGRHHFECEVESNLAIALFYADRIQHLAWELLTRLNEPLDTRVKRVLELFKV